MLVALVESDCLIFFMWPDHIFPDDQAPDDKKPAYRLLAGTETTTPFVKGTPIRLVAPLQNLDRHEGVESVQSYHISHFSQPAALDDTSDLAPKTCKYVRCKYPMKAGVRKWD